MKRHALAALLLATCAIVPLELVACGSGNAATPAVPDSGTDGATTQEDGGAVGSTDGATGDRDSPADASGPAPVAFAYTPQWSGATKVEVVGGFGQATDWSKAASLLTLTAPTSAGGPFTGTALLPPGTYLYLFRITGDDQGGNPPATQHYAVDPRQTAYAACPMASPTYSAIESNPCSQLTVTAAGGGAPAAAVHVKGVVNLGGAPAKGWMVWLEREEPKSHHFFANRITLAQDGAFDLVASTGNYRLQIQYPTLMSASDLSRDPASLGALRRAISSAFPLASTDLTVPTPDVAFTDYGSFRATDLGGDGGSLPAQFSFESGPAHLDLYGGPGDGGVVSIGDPWYASGIVTDGGATFGGAFNTTQAQQDAAAPGTRYMWGTEQPSGADASVSWTNQSMVLPIVWR